MPSAQGYISDEQEEVVEEELIGQEFDDMSSFVQFCISYTLYNKFGVES